MGAGGRGRARRLGLRTPDGGDRRPRPCDRVLAQRARDRAARARGGRDPAARAARARPARDPAAGGGRGGTSPPLRDLDHGAQADVGGVGDGAGMPPSRLRGADRPLARGPGARGGAGRAGPRVRRCAGGRRRRRDGVDRRRDRRPARALRRVLRRDLHLVGLGPAALAVDVDVHVAVLRPLRAAPARGVPGLGPVHQSGTTPRRGPASSPSRCQRSCSGTRSSTTCSRR